MDDAGHWVITIVLIDSGPNRYETFPAGKRHQNDVETTWKRRENDMNMTRKKENEMTMI